MLRRTVTTLRLPAKTYRSPSERKEAVKWGRWLFCDICSYNGDRDYCASVNIARLGVAYLGQMKQTGKARSCPITHPRVKPVSYTGAGAALLLPPPSTHARPIVSGKICYYPGCLVLLSPSHLTISVASYDCVDGSLLLRIVAYFTNRCPNLPSNCV